MHFAQVSGLFPDRAPEWPPLTAALPRLWHRQGRESGMAAHLNSPAKWPVCALVWPLFLGRDDIWGTSMHPPWQSHEVYHTAFSGLFKKISASSKQYPSILSFVMKNPTLFLAKVE
jgi:hypothetical protein